MTDPEAFLERFREDRPGLLADLRARLADIERLAAGPHAGIPVIDQELERARTYITSLVEAVERPEADAASIRFAIEENRPARTPRALLGEDRFLAARPYVRTVPDDERPEEVWIRWDAVPYELREDVVSLASMYRDIIIGRKIGRPKKEAS